MKKIKNRRPFQILMEDDSSRMIETKKPLFRVI